MVLSARNIARVLLVCLINTAQCRGAADPQTKTTDLGRESACTLLLYINMILETFACIAKQVFPVVSAPF